MDSDSERSPEAPFRERPAEEPHIRIPGNAERPADQRLGRGPDSGRGDAGNHPSPHRTTLCSTGGHAEPRDTPAPDPRGDGSRVIARVHRRERRHRGDAHDRTGSRSRPDRRAVDLPLLLPRPRRALSRRRRPGRSLRTPAGLLLGCDRLCGRLGACRGRAQRGHTDRRSHPPGCRGRLPDHELLGPPARRLRRERRTSDRPLDVIHERGRAGRPAGGRRTRRVGVVALDLLPEPTRCSTDARGGGSRPLRRAKHAAGGAARPSGRRPLRNRVRRAHLRSRRGGGQGVRQRLVGGCGRGGSARRLRLGGAPGRGADAGLQALPPAELRRGQPGDVFRLRRPLRATRLRPALSCSSWVSVPSKPRSWGFRPA